MAFTVQQLVARFGGTLQGDGARTIDGLAPLDRAQANHLAFLANPKYLPQVATSTAGAVLVTETDLARLSPEERAANTAAWIVTPKPYAYFARVAQLFVAAAEPVVPPGVHPSAQVDPTATVAASATLGAHVVIEAGAVIGERVRIDANTVVGRGTRLGDDTRLYPNVTVYHGCVLGQRVIVHSGAVIGGDGFGFAPDFADDTRPDIEGEWVKIPQVGGVRIGDDVEIGANTTIDRGAMSDTVIAHAVKIDNLVQIAHNCRVGAYTVIAACAGIAGSTVIGRHCMIGGAVGIAGHVTLGDRVIVTAKSGVSKSLPRAGVYTSAFPAIDNADWNKNAAVMRNLDKMRDRVKQLEAAVAALQAGPKAGQ
ncbi:MAG: UDP-3-O-(3-hydroxymyristoyl)glucosamine N-acyltransferase [Janthinobacterium lividum]